MIPKGLGRLQKVELREAWSSESSDFTPWLAQPDNLSLLGETIGMELELEAQEKNVGPFRADILCKDTATDRWVLVENQLEKTDHTHLGQLLTYAAGLEAVIIVWISERFTPEHRAALDWLNERTDDQINFFGLEVELWQIGNSPVAPKFNIVSQPNDWTQTIAQSAKELQAGSLTEAKQTQLEFWRQFRVHLENTGSFLRTTKPLPQHWMNLAVGRTGFKLIAFFTPAKMRVGASLVMNDTNAKSYFRQLEADKAAIEAEAGCPLLWEELPTRKESRVSWHNLQIDPTDQTAWPKLHNWLSTNLETLHKVLSPCVKLLEAEFDPGTEND